MKVLLAYGWPGNVRELRSAFEYAFVTCQEELIQPEHLPPMILGDCAPRAGSSVLPPAPDQKRQALLEVLKQSGGNRSEAARRLGISRVTIWNRMKKLGISPPNPFG